MKKLKLTALISSLIIMISFLTSCENIDKVSNISDILTEETTSVIEYVTEISGTETTANKVTTSIETYPEYPVTYPVIQETDTVAKYQAEDINISGFTEKQQINGFDGKGYITGFNEGNKFTFPVEVPSNQHYDLTFCIASEKEENCYIEINDRKTGFFRTSNDAKAIGKFTRITMHGVFLTEGKSNISISTENSDISLDYLEISNNTTLKNIDYNINGKLSNDNAEKSASGLMKFLSDNYGKYVITGQYASDETNKEIDEIYSVTGKKPVIRFSALETSYNSYDESFKDIDACVDWYKNGGIVGLMWYWRSPDENASVYTNETDFSLANAVTDIDISCMSQEEIRGLYGEGKISKECYGLILDIDNISGQLISLQNKGIPVLWRPLHEASGNWFWWGASGADNYRWLWKLMYKRMTEYFELNNLIWIWNGQSKEYIVPENTFDIASVDIYTPADQHYGSRYEQFASLQEFIGKEKIIALSECSSIPDIDAVFRDNSVWSFFGLWYGEYLSENYMTKDYIIKNYNSSGALTLDEYKSHQF